MSKEYTQEDLWKIFETLPEEIKEAMLSEYTANHVRRISEKYELDELKMSKLAESIGDVFLGLLPLDHLETTLTSDLGLAKEPAEKANREINRFIFFPVKSALEQLYQKKDKKEATVEQAETEDNTDKQADRYREEVE